MFLNQLRASVDAAATLGAIAELERVIWQTAWPNHIDDATASDLAEVLNAKRKVLNAAPPRLVGFTRARPKLQRSPDKQASIERRRQLARASPVPPALVDKFTQGEHAVVTVVAGEIQRAGACTWCLDRIAAVAGVCKTVVRNAIRKARDHKLLFSVERRRRGQKSLTNIVRVLHQSWGAWLKRIGCIFPKSTTKTDFRNGADGAVDRSGKRSFEVKVANLVPRRLLT